MSCQICLQTETRHKAAQKNCVNEHPEQTENPCGARAKSFTSTIPQAQMVGRFPALCTVNVTQQTVGICASSVQREVTYCKVFVQPIFSLFSVYFPDICVQTEIGYLSTVLDSVGISQSGISVVLH